MFLPFLIIKYLRTLERLIKKGLKKGYSSLDKDFNNRIKGKIILKETYQRYFTKGVYTKTRCRFQMLAEDFLDNQILKCALVQATKYLGVTNLNISEINNLASYLNCMFEKISLRRISDFDFVKIKHSPFFPEYKEALELARLILKSLGYDPLIDVNEVQRVPPYMINMPKLFELFVWNKLKKIYGGVLYQKGYGKDVPDFIISGEGIVIDAKYKYEYNYGEEFSKADVGQLSRYGRNKKIRKEVFGKENCEPALFIIYPSFSESNESNKLELERQKESLTDYYYIYKLPLTVPYFEG